MKSNPPCTIEHLRKSLRYNPHTGTFTWIWHHHRKDLVGSIAGSAQSAGYWSIAIYNRKQLAHRLAWFYVTGVWPTQHIDHKNGVKTDNRIENLRKVTRAENLQNIRRATKANKIGFLGVCAHQGKWLMQIMANGKRIRKSGFDTPEEAHQAYLKAKREHHAACTI